MKKDGKPETYPYVIRCNNCRKRITIGIKRGVSVEKHLENKKKIKCEHCDCEVKA